MIEVPNIWKEKFPNYNLYFHDDIAVDNLMYNLQWPEFPQIHNILQSCVKFGGAMKIDIWRVLVLYRYGGFYTDYEISPGPKFTPNLIQSNDTAIVFSDGMNRPSQWLHGMTSKHPIAYYTLLEIIRKVSKLQNVAKVRLVYTTGPDALKKGYSMVIDNEEYKTIYNVGTHYSNLLVNGNGPIQKYPKKGYVALPLNGQMDTLVPYPRPKPPDITKNNNNNNSNTNTNTNTNVTMITKMERLRKEMNTTHWLNVVRGQKNNKDLPTDSCVVSDVCVGVAVALAFLYLFFVVHHHDI